MKRARPKKPPAPFTYGIEDGVTQSLLTGWVHCRKSARLTLDGWRKPETSHPLAYGGLWHFLLEGLYEAIRTRTIASRTAVTRSPLPLCHPRGEYRSAAGIALPLD